MGKSKLEHGNAGRYTSQGERLLHETGAEIVVLIVLGGAKGHGFSISATRPVGGSEAAVILRGIADTVDGAEPDGLETREHR